MTRIPSSHMKTRQRNSNVTQQKAEVALCFRLDEIQGMCYTNEIKNVIKKIGFKTTKTKQELHSGF